MKTDVARFTSTPEGMKLFQQEALKVAVSEAIYRAMRERDVTVAELAQSIDMPHRRLDDCLDCNSLMSTEIIADCLTTLGFRMKVSIELIEYPADYGTRENP